MNSDEQMSKSSDVVNKKWIDAHYDPVASLYTFSQCIALADITSDGDHKLIIADLGTGSYDMKLKVYKGTSLLTENNIMDLPTGVESFYMDTNEPRTPAIAVASGPYIFVYKNLRPYFKFTLPPLDVNPMEVDLWNQAKEEKVQVSVLREMLDGLRTEGIPLTVRSLKFLQLQAQELMAFVNLHRETPLKKQTIITCLSTLKKSYAEEGSVSCLVIGTESHQVCVLDPEAFTVLSTVDLPSVPVFFNVSGLFDVEYRIIVTCRNGGIYILKRDMKEVSKASVQLDSQAVGLQRLGKRVVIGCMDETLRCYSTMGKKLWSVKMPAAITTMDILENKNKGFKAVMVALGNSEIRIYKDKFLVDTIATEDVVTGMRFGQFGREEAALVMATRGGGLIVKILRRTATFEDKDSVMGPPAAQNVKLNVPKKTKLFVDQTLRERENAVFMHRQFQHDLYRLRLETARHYAKALQTRLNPISTSLEDPLTLSAQVQGIGPTFKLTLNVQNTSLSKSVINVMLTFDYDVTLYSIEKTLIHLPMLVPGLSFAFQTFVSCLSNKAISDNIKVFVVKKDCNVPIITAVINMPVSESMVIV